MLSRHYPNNMKKIIYIIILVIGLGGAIVLGYVAFFGGQSATVDTSTGGAQTYNILPEGKTLDFSTVKNFNKDGRIFNFPQVNSAEIGQSLTNLIE